MVPCGRRKEDHPTVRLLRRSDGLAGLVGCARLHNLPATAVRRLQALADHSVDHDGADHRILLRLRVRLAAWVLAGQRQLGAGSRPYQMLKLGSV